MAEGKEVSSLFADIGKKKEEGTLSPSFKTLKPDFSYLKSLLQGKNLSSLAEKFHEEIPAEKAFVIPAGDGNVYVAGDLHGNLADFRGVVAPFIDDRVIRYTVRRLLTIVPIFIGTSMISYALMSSTGNPIDFILSGYSFPEGLEELREQLTRIYGLDAPPQTQWLNWFFHFIMGDMGNSIYGGGPVARTIAGKIGPTLVISIVPLIFTLLIAVVFGAQTGHR